MIATDEGVAEALRDLAEQGDTAITDLPDLGVSAEVARNTLAVLLYDREIRADANRVLRPGSGTRRGQ